MPSSRRFVGLDAYEKAIDRGRGHRASGTPPASAPAFRRGGQGRKHVFMEKPVAVDAPGLPAVQAANEEAKKKGLYVAVGLQRRHAEATSRHQAHPRRRDRRPILLRGPTGTTAASGSARGSRSRPKWNTRCATGTTSIGYAAITSSSSTFTTSTSATGSRRVPGQGPRAMGGRQVRDGQGVRRDLRSPLRRVHLSRRDEQLSECRQQPGTWSNFSHHAHGTKGTVSFEGGDAVTIQLRGSSPTKLKPQRDGHQTEWDDFVAAILAGRPCNEADCGGRQHDDGDPRPDGDLLRQARHLGRGREVRPDLRPRPPRLGRRAEVEAGQGRHLLCAMPGITTAL